MSLPPFYAAEITTTCKEQERKLMRGKEGALFYFGSTRVGSIRREFIIFSTRLVQFSCSDITHMDSLNLAEHNQQ